MMISFYVVNSRDIFNFCEKINALNVQIQLKIVRV